METNEKLRDVILGRLLDSFSQIRSSRVCSCSLWIIGEYCRGRTEITSALEVNPSACGGSICGTSGSHPHSFCQNPQRSWGKLEWWGCKRLCWSGMPCKLNCPAAAGGGAEWSLCRGTAKLSSEGRI